MRYGATEITATIIYNKEHLRPDPDPSEKARKRKKKKGYFFYFFIAYVTEIEKKINVTRQVER